MAVRKGHLEVVRLLLQNGADIHCDNNNIIKWCDDHSNTEMAKYIKEILDNEKKLKDEETRNAFKDSIKEVIKEIHDNEKKSQDINYIEAINNFKKVMENVTIKDLANDEFKKNIRSLADIVNYIAKCCD